MCLLNTAPKNNMKNLFNYTLTVNAFFSAQTTCIQGLYVVFGLHIFI